MTDVETLARRFHEAYERLAPSFGYETRAETRHFDPASDNGRLMIAVCAEIAQYWNAIKVGGEPEDACEQFIAAEIDSAPDALRRLGDWLSNVLDEDDNKTAASMVLGAMLETSAAVRNAGSSPAPAPTHGMVPWQVLADCVEHMEWSTPQGRKAYEAAIVALTPRDDAGEW